MTAVWRDSVQRAESMQAVPEVDYNKTGFAGALTYDAVCKDISLDGSGTWHYEATADGLTEGTVYMYRVGCSGAWSDVKKFTTAEHDGESVTFAYLGDVQTESDNDGELDKWSALTQTMYKKNPELAFAVLGGDIVENGIRTALFDAFFEHAGGVFSGVPLVATNGNHESNFTSGKPELYLDYFALPQNGPEGFKEEFYSFDYANCHIMIVNSWVFSGEQKLTDADTERINTWIKNDLAASTADWQIVVTHVPVYAVHSDTTAEAVRENWAPIFEQYGVDLVFEGHQHVYSRSFPMYEGKVDYENGITYIMGNSGQKFYSSADESFAEKTIYNTATYQLVRADGGTLTVRTFDTDGNELDYVNINQRESTVKLTENVAYDLRKHAVVSSGMMAALLCGLF